MSLFEWLSDSKTYKKLDESFSNQVSNLNPDTVLILLNAFLWIAIFIFIVYWGVKIYKIAKTPGKDLIKKYKENLQRTSDDSKQKSIILTLIDQVNDEIKDLVSLDDQKTDLVHEHGKKVLNFTTTQVPLSLKSTKSINHRCAVFVLDEEDPSKLKIFEGCGYSIKGKEKLRLDSKESIAGKAFTSGEYQYEKDLTKSKDFKPHPKATKEYFSLLCYPVVVNEKVVAVLSIDGSVKDCFTKDDIAYVKMFSNLVGITLSVMKYNVTNQKERGDIDGEIQNTG
ncbi:GAF domain-containing protein [Halalkalibacter krulwichiae]|uniref:GAF domain protein n=1 Tax=Halalkalibacter krulwichiae TaxID=199441 RepID=A0A1X9M5T9_9BACI|nr:GAF domain-containing protein [Halalkalibacter krulwichiae]ARK28809.1 GAF domain protein [Halalkalibacter krulwichiae]ARK32120.1 GAF domain protein [Halalkalibacter krulwichiae]